MYLQLTKFVSWLKDDFLCLFLFCYPENDFWRGDTSLEYFSHYYLAFRARLICLRGHDSIRREEEEKKTVLRDSEWFVGVWNSSMARQHKETHKQLNLDA